MLKQLQLTQQLPPNWKRQLSLKLLLNLLQFKKQLPLYQLQLKKISEPKTNATNNSNQGNNGNSGNNNSNNSNNNNNGSNNNNSHVSLDFNINNQSSKEAIAVFYNSALNNSKAVKSVNGTEQPLVYNIIDLGDLSSTFVDMVYKAMPGILASVFMPGTNKGLPVVNYSDDRRLDNIQLLPNDIKTFNVVDNGSLLELTITPEAVTNPTIGNDAQGRFFQICGNVNEVIWCLGDSIRFNSGIEQGLTLNYQNGTGKIIVDKTTGLITYAEYLTHIDITLKDVKVLKVINIQEGTLTFDCGTIYQ